MVAEGLPSDVAGDELVGGRPLLPPEPPTDAPEHKPAASPTGYVVPLAHVLLETPYNSVSVKYQSQLGSVHSIEITVLSTGCDEGKLAKRPMMHIDYLQDCLEGHLLL